jgi:hypothetical protein
MAKVGKAGKKNLRGFALMSKLRISEVAKLGGLVRARQLGRAGYVEIGRRGGLTRARQLGHDGYVSMGRKGGLSRKKARKKRENEEETIQPGKPERRQMNVKRPLNEESVPPQRKVSNVPHH